MDTANSCCADKHSLSSKTKEVRRSFVKMSMKISTNHRTIKDGTADQGKDWKLYATFVSEADLPVFFVKHWASLLKARCIQTFLCPQSHFSIWWPDMATQRWLNTCWWEERPFPTIIHLCTGIKAHKLVLFMKVKWPQDSGKPISTACLLRPYILYIYCRSSWGWLVWFGMITQRQFC